MRVGAGRGGGSDEGESLSWDKRRKEVEWKKTAEEIRGLECLWGGDQEGEQVLWSVLKSSLRGGRSSTKTGRGRGSCLGGRGRRSAEDEG